MKIKKVLILVTITILLIVGFRFFIKGNSSFINKLGTTFIRKGSWEAAVVAQAPRPSIDMLYPTRSGGRTWQDKWDNNISRKITSGKRDQNDAELIIRGTGSASIDGKGVLTLSGDSPRIYVYDKDLKKKWNNVEVTVYAKRISETGVRSSQGFVIGARSEHQNASETNVCSGRSYYGRLLYDGRAVFQKEIIHEGSYSSNKPSETNKVNWGTADGKIPKNKWIGMKFIVRTSADGKAVTLQIYRDLTEGKDGGSWIKIAEYVDRGDWSQINKNIDVMTKCGYPANKVLTMPGSSVFIRNDMVSNAQYKWFSIREI